MCSNIKHFFPEKKYVLNIRDIGILWSTYYIYLYIIFLEGLFNEFREEEVQSPAAKISWLEATLAEPAKYGPPLPNVHFKILMRLSGRRGVPGGKRLQAGSQRAAGLDTPPPGSALGLKKLATPMGELGGLLHEGVVVIYNPATPSA